MAVIDVFSFNGELDVLEIRLNVLNDVVDQFIICESDETFTGLKKPLYFLENKERYAKFLPKIKHFKMASNDPILQREATNSPGVPKELHWWVREFTQKESMRYALTHLNDDDLVFIGDCDEIWNPELIQGQHIFKTKHKLEQTVYVYYLNNRSSEKHAMSDRAWLGTFAAPYIYIKQDTLDNLRAYDQHRQRMLPATIPNAGWHFTNMGDAEFIKRKLNSYSHQEFNNPNVTDWIEDRIGANLDFIGRDFKFTIDELGLPDYVIQNKEKYKHLWK